MRGVAYGWLRGVVLASVMGIAAPLGLGALGACESADRVTTLPIVLRQLGSCALGGPAESLAVTALGDFPSRSVQAAPTELSTVFERLPTATREISLLATGASQSSVGRHGLLDRPVEQAVWMLPPGASCPLADDLMRVVDGAAVVALPGASVLVVGGTIGRTLASAEALLLLEGTEAATPVPGGMLLRRAFASASLLGAKVVVAGGTADMRGSAHDTYEVFALAEQRFDAAVSGKLASPRMQHAALALSADQLLIVGGCAEAGGAPLASAELLELSARTTRPLSDEHGLLEPRLAPFVLRLDSGTSLVLAGRDEAGRLLGSVERWEPSEQRFTRVAQGLPVHAELAVASLPGARVAWLSCDQGSGARCLLELLFEGPADFSHVPVELPFAELAPQGLSELRLWALPFGQLLLTAADDSDPSGRRRAFSIDPIAQTLSRVDASRVPKQLFGLDNGVIVELDETGTSLRAAGSEGRFASPQGNLVRSVSSLEESSPYLALSASAAFEREAEGLRARAQGARADVAELRFAAARFVFAVAGQAELLLYDEHEPAAQPSVRVTREQVDVQGCTLPRPDETQAAPLTLTLERSGTRLSVSAAGVVGTCSAHVSAGALGVGVRLDEGALLQSLSVERL